MGESLTLRLDRFILQQTQPSTVEQRKHKHEQTCTRK
jgi:hypothetical protein